MSRPSVAAEHSLQSAGTTFLSPRRIELLLGGVLAVALGIDILVAGFYLRVLPAEDGVSRAIDRGGESDLFSGCGAAVYRLDSRTSDAIARKGAAFFTGVRHSRKSSDAYHTFGRWQPTPDARFVHDDQTLLSPGLECADLDPGLQQIITDATRQPGSYYAYGPEKTLLVVPSLRLVVLAWNG